MTIYQFCYHYGEEVKLVTLWQIPLYLLKESIGPVFSSGGVHSNKKGLDIKIIVRVHDLLCFADILK